MQRAIPRSLPAVEPERAGTEGGEDWSVNTGGAPQGSATAGGEIDRATEKRIPLITDDIPVLRMAQELARIEDVSRESLLNDHWCGYLDQALLTAARGWIEPPRMTDIISTYVKLRTRCQHSRDLIHVCDLKRDTRGNSQEKRRRLAARNP